MKKLFSVLMFFYFVFYQLNLLAQIPQAIPYQAVARDVNGNILSTHAIALRFSIHDITSVGTIVYSETHTVSTNSLGLFTVNIGQGTVITGIFSAVDWGGGSKFMQVEMDTAAGTNYVDMGTQQLLSVPYALSAGNGNWNKTGNDISNSNSGKVGIGTSSPAAKLDINGNIKITDGTQGEGKVLTSDPNGLATWKPGVGSGTAIGQMSYWDGAAWLLVQPGQNNQTLSYCNGVPIWGPCPVVLPVVTTSNVTSILAYSATSGGNVTYDGNTNVTARGICWDIFPNPTTALSTKTSDGTGSGLFTSALSNLTLNTIYHVRAYATNSVGTAYGADVTFTSSSMAPPTVSTNSPSSLTGTTATLNGTVNPNALATTCWFRYSTVSPGTGNDTFGTRTPASGGSSAGAGSSAVTFSESISGLSPGTTYYYCAIAQNSMGISFGALGTFTTPLPPSVSTSSASSILGTAVTLNGSGNPNRAATTAWFRYSTTNPGTANDVFGTRSPSSGGSSLGSGSSSVAFSQSVTGLIAGTTYYYCAIASNSEGISFGSIINFTTAAAPSASTNAATLVTSTTATLNGNANPNNASTTGWYRYSTTNPLTGNDVFGTRVPLSGGTSLGAGSSSVAFSEVITSLLPGTTYYYCAIASNAEGISFGTVSSFTTLANAPNVTSNSPTSTTGTTATLNGSGNPGGAATTGWFRYSTVSPGTGNDTFGTRAPSSGGSSLGSGTSSVAFSQGITGLSPGTTYYYCAIAQNSMGISFGALGTFTTPLPPTVSTSSASSILGTSVTLNGSGNPNRAATTAWFRYSTTNPGTANDVFGTRTPASGGTSLGSGSSSVAFSQPVTGLIAGTTYYYCAIASNAEGISFGSILNFTTPAAPSASTNTATLVTSSSATLNGSGIPNGASATGWYRYSTTNPVTGNDVFGTRAPSSGGASLGSGFSTITYSQSITGLSPGTTYYFCAIVSNSEGISFGTISSFTTLANAPNVTSNSPTSTTGTTATLNGSGNPGGAATTGWFRYSTVSPGTGNDTFGTRAPSSGGSSLGSGTSSVAFSQGITGLSPGTTYFYCAIAQNSVGISFGALGTFTTPLPPVVSTSSASSILGTSVNLNGSGNPNRAATTAWFRYSTTNPGTANDVFGTRTPSSGGSSLGSGSSAVAFSQSVTGLIAGTTYYYCAIASNSEGISFGSIVSFTTPAAPSATTNTATLVTSSSATLNGGGIPNGAATTGWYRYSTTNPVTGNDVFGTRAPSSGGASLGSGFSTITYSQSITGLSPATTYYYCAITSNSEGISFGTVLSFTTNAALPNVTTNSPTSTTSTTTTLNGTVNPGGAATTGWFRYSTVSPGTGNDTFGTRAPSSGGTAVGSGISSVAFSQSITGLSPGTTYFFCAISQNSVGISFGAIQSFTTP